MLKDPWVLKVLKVTEDLQVLRVSKESKETEDHKEAEVIRDLQDLQSLVMLTPYQRRAKPRLMLSVKINAEMRVQSIQLILHCVLSVVHYLLTQHVIIRIVFQDVKVNGCFYVMSLVQ